MCPSFQLRNTVHVHSHNKPLIFTVDMDKLPTVPFFLSSLFPVPHCTTTRIICLKCKFDHSILLLQNGFSPMASQSYIGFGDHPRPASSLRQPLWFLGLSLSALHSQGTSTGTLSPPWCFTHRPLCLEFSLLSHIPPAVWSACGNSLSSWKTQVFIQEDFQTEMSSFPLCAFTGTRVAFLILLQQLFVPINSTFIILSQSMARRTMASTISAYEKHQCLALIFNRLLQGLRFDNHWPQGLVSPIGTRQVRNEYKYLIALEPRAGLLQLLVQVSRVAAQGLFRLVHHNVYYPRAQPRALGHVRY